MSIQSMLVGSNSQPITVSAGPAIASGSRSGAGAVTTTSTLATPAGGTGPYTYAWTLSSGDSSIIISSASAANPNWHSTLNVGEDKSASWQVIVTDSFGNISPPSNSVFVFLRETSYV